MADIAIQILGSKRMIRLLARSAAIVLLSLASAPCFAQNSGPTVRWPAPELNDTSFDDWLNFIRPSQDDAKWQRMRWHKELEDAAREAKELHRPILLWTMNGHPCGET